MGSAGSRWPGKGSLRRRHLVRDLWDMKVCTVRCRHVRRAPGYRFEEPHVAVASEWRVAGNGICKVTRCQAEHCCVESDFYLPLGSAGQRMLCLRC